MVASRQTATTHSLASTVHMDAPEFATAVVSCGVVYCMYLHGGIALGTISAILTCIVIAPFFTTSHTQVSGGHARQVPVLEQNQSSNIYLEVDPRELGTMRETEYSLFGRFVHQAIEMWSDDIEELIYVAQVLRENNGLLLLLFGGVSSMMLALAAGLDDMSVLKAASLSIACYGITTLLVSRSARGISNQQMAQNGEPKLCSEEVDRIIKALPVEQFVPEDEIESCDLSQIKDMLCRRNIMVPKVDLPEQISDDCDTQDSIFQKQSLVKVLMQRRNYNESCCICLSSFQCGESINVLLGCSHEFHVHCLSQWAGTFATSKNRWSNCNKRGRPTCPLCKHAIR